MRTARIRQKIYEYLREKPRTTEEIREYICSRSKYGTCNHSLAAILCKDPKVKAIGRTNKQSLRDMNILHDYILTIWALKED